jgi:glycosyltransferase involved in cell wall biosynthesis
MPDVILPALDEAKAIGWVLERMPNGYHPIVVDNGSTDATGRRSANQGFWFSVLGRTTGGHQ